MSAPVSVILCGPSQSGKSYLCQQMLSPQPISPGEASTSSSFTIGNGIQSCTKALELRNVGDRLVIIDTVGFPDYDAKSRETNATIFNLVLGVTIGQDKYDEAIRAYANAMEDEGVPPGSIRQRVAQCVDVGQRATRLGVMGNVDTCVFVIPCNNAKLLHQSPVPMMEDFWAMCGGWKLIGSNTRGTLAISNNHNAVSNAGWTKAVADDFAKNFWFGENDFVAMANSYLELHSLAKERLAEILSSIRSRSWSGKRVSRLIRQDEFVAIGGRVGEAAAKRRGRNVDPWCRISMQFGRVALPALR